eukprot:1138942-Pelagomonas_calceolata.AAC.1
MSSAENLNKKARVEKGRSDGVSGQMIQRALAYGQPRREYGLVGKGADEDGQLMAGCSLCDVT